MKKVTIVLALFFLLSTASLAKIKQPAPDFVKILQTRNHILFIKVHKFFVGGRIEIYNSDMHFLESNDVPHTHTKMFFHDAPAGKYIIKVTKEGMSFEFDYINAQ